MGKVTIRSLWLVFSFVGHEHSERHQVSMSVRNQLSQERQVSRLEH
jgi:hypothetical protein